MKSMRFFAFGLAATLALVNLAAGQPPRRPLPPGVNVLRDLPYVENGHERNRLDLYLPEKANHGRLPLVVWIHGGAWQASNKDNCPAVWLTAKGYAVASINYRLSQHAVFPAQIEDCKAAIRWLRANAGQVPSGPGPYRRLGAFGRRPPGGHARHDRRREGVGGQGRQSRPVQPRPVRCRLVRPHGLDDDGRAGRQAGHRRWQN